MEAPNVFAALERAHSWRKLLQLWLLRHLQPDLSGEVGLHLLLPDLPPDPPQFVSDPLLFASSLPGSFSFALPLSVPLESEVCCIAHHTLERDFLKLGPVEIEDASIQERVVIPAPEVIVVHSTGLTEGATIDHTFILLIRLVLLKLIEKSLTPLLVIFIRLHQLLLFIQKILNALLLVVVDLEVGLLYLELAVEALYFDEGTVVVEVLLQLAVIVFHRIALFILKLDHNLFVNILKFSIKFSLIN